MPPGVQTAPTLFQHPFHISLLGNESNRVANKSLPSLVSDGGEDISSSGSAASSSSTASPSPVVHHQCSGQCSQTSRTCSWGFTGDCACNAPKLDAGAIFFWWQWPCLATDTNPFNDPSTSPTSSPSDAEETSSGVSGDKRRIRRITTAAIAALGPKLDPDRVPGVCNSSYISYACTNASGDGIVHEDLTNWLGALLPVGEMSYPPVPEGFLRAHGIKGEVDFAGVTPLYY